MTGRWHSLVIDCPDPQTLARFYAELLGMALVRATPDHVEIADQTTGPRMVFQRTDQFRAPRWPQSDPPQQMHIDVVVADLDLEQARVLSLGATLLEGSDKPIGYRVYADPAGHPFCLVTPEGLPQPDH